MSLPNRLLKNVGGARCPSTFKVEDGRLEGTDWRAPAAASARRREPRPAVLRSGHEAHTRRDLSALSWLRWSRSEFVAHAPASVIHSGDWRRMKFLEDGQLELDNLHDGIGA